MRPGPPAPWSGVPEARRVGLTLPTVRRGLARLASRDHRGSVPGAHQAAVLILLFENDGETGVVLTRRASTLRLHTSEVAFPGGRVESGESLVHAALREAHEEIGLDPDAVEIIATLSQLSTVSSAMEITPFVGVTPGRPALWPNPSEVETVFDVALATLAADGVYRAERWPRGDGEIEVHFFELPDDLVWGATARMLTELLTAVLVE